MGPAMENVMKTPSRWRSANREDEKAVAAAAEIIMENIQSAPPLPTVSVCHDHKRARSDAGRMFFIYFYKTAAPGSAARPWAEHGAEGEGKSDRC